MKQHADRVSSRIVIYALLFVGLLAFSISCAIEGGSTDGEQVSMPGFDVPGGTYVTGKTVVVTCATVGASILYTTNGDEPTRLNGVSIVSGESIFIASSCTLKAMAYKSGMLDSEARSVSYAITGAGEGDLAVGLSWPEGSVPNPSITATLSTIEAVPTSIALDFLVEANCASWMDVDIAAGAYRLTLQLIDDGVPVWGVRQDIAVTTDESFNLSFDLVSGQLRQAPATPGAPGLTEVSRTAVSMGWSDESLVESGYLVERKTGSGSFEPIGGTLAEDSVTFIDSTVEAGLSYAYRVRAVNSWGSSSYSEEVAVDACSNWDDATWDVYCWEP